MKAKGELPVSPAALMSLLLATGCAAAFHVVFGGSVRRLVAYVVAAWLGFSVGQWAGGFLPLTALDIGPVHVVSATLVCLLTLFVTRWLAQVPPVQVQD